MKLFIDTANIEEIREIARWGVIQGVTTNPKIFSSEDVKEPRFARPPARGMEPRAGTAPVPPGLPGAPSAVDLKTRVEEILAVVPGPLSIEVTTNDLDEMIVEAQRFASWSQHIVVKVPMSPAGLQAVQILKQKNIKTNVTAVMTVNQAMLAALAGATYTSIFFARINDIGYDAREVVLQASTLFKQSGFTTQIIVGSIRVMTQINEAALAGADVITVPYKFFNQLATHPQTEKTIQEFLDAWSGIKSPA